MLKRANIFICILVLNLAATLFAETVGTPASLGFPKGPGIISKDRFIEKGLNPIYITGLTEFVIKKKLDSSTTSNLEIKGYWFLGKVALAVNEKFQPFILLGGSSLDLSGDLGVTKIKSAGDGNFAYGGGFSWLLYEVPDQKISLAVSGLYRESKLNGSMRQPTTRISNLKTKIKEIELALTAYKDSIIWNIPVRPYASIYYADSDVNFKFNTNSGSVTYDLGAIDNHRNIGLAIGLEKEPIKGLALNAEVRFFTELGVTAGFTLKF